MALLPPADPLDENALLALLQSDAPEQGGGAVIRKPTIESESVLDSTPEKYYKQFQKFIGADDPNSVMIGGAMEVPGKKAALQALLQTKKAAGAPHEEIVRLLHEIKQTSRTGKQGIPIQVGGREVQVVRNPTAAMQKHKLVPVDVAKFDQAWQHDKGLHIDPSGKNAIGNRLQGVKDFLEWAPTMDAPEAGVTDQGTAYFTDGRHRMAYLRDTGHTEVPVTMSKESLKNAEKFGLLAIVKKYGIAGALAAGLINESQARQLQGSE